MSFDVRVQVPPRVRCEVSGHRSVDVPRFFLFWGAHVSGHRALCFGPQPSYSPHVSSFVLAVLGNGPFSTRKREQNDQKWCLLNTLDLDLPLKVGLVLF